MSMADIREIMKVHRRHEMEKHNLRMNHHHEHHQMAHRHTQEHMDLHAKHEREIASGEEEPGAKEAESEERKAA